MTRILFVCLGNICRSPTAHGVFEELIRQQGMTEFVEVDSAGTAAYHIGNPPDSRSARVAKQRGFPLDHLRARQVSPDDYQQFDYILTMDKQNLAELKRGCPAGFQGHLGLFLDFCQAPESEVPDPYYGGADGFEKVLNLVIDASRGLIHHLQQELPRS
ncbi:low molecular weight protein-tyrosine-phosphatase [Neptuniibacter sp. CAU 1671]|uniref:low molecular weight protein-tyrosine-phosphatase n=1 Tax=Neptuniibacter sp. CAU 1671 TaxID=3032593 RepID=UPI0023DAD2F7|nr:low molecular weight protein-tyrosine-phosphatase [Neptuniibacter sp. CAU 1671]MDF2180802.1 low molecular weight phosphotyrosine protein phosphatase [Neptuniibacter sp. CAU 1671]